MSSTDTHPEAFVLLHIPDVTLTAAGARESGTLALECVTLAPNGDDKSAPLAASLSSDDRSLYLVLRLNTLELPLDPTRPISVQVTPDGSRTYTFQSADASPVEAPGSPIYLTVPIPTRPDAHRAETIEAFDHILIQYAEVQGLQPSPISGSPQGQPEGAASSSSAPAPPAQEDLRGKLVLMDEESGEVVGELPHGVHVKEDPALSHTAKGADGAPAPVLLELPPDVYDAYTGQGASVVPYHSPESDLEEAKEIFVRAIPPEDQDWITKSATVISQAISTSTSMLLNGLTSAANYYIQHSTPSPHASGTQTPQATKDGAPPPPPPRALLLLSHPRTHSTLSRAYAISGQAVRVSGKTIGVVESMIRRAVGGHDKPKAPTIRQPQRPTAPGTTVSAPAPLPATSAAASSSSLQEPPPPYPGPGTSSTPDGKPPVPPRPGPPPPLPPRSRSRSPYPPGEKSASTTPPQSTPATPGAPGAAGGPPPLPLRKREKLVLSANLVLATVDDSLKRAVDVGSKQLTAVVGHKYGEGAGKTTHLATHTARNVTLVYIDMQGLARRALIRKAGKEWVKARLSGRKHQQQQIDGVVVDKPGADQK
ncbi:hypothetical protein C8Q77DRAFT_1145079 [Trametes polyzona]|nr:hypothetical protein C8Q77DRAFT_1145079 [Trametes polyzona]